MRYLLACLFSLLLGGCYCIAQDSLQYTALKKLPNSYFDKTAKTTSSLSSHIEKKSQKLLRKLKKQEEKLIKKLKQSDSAGAKAILIDANAKYEQLSANLSQSNPALVNKTSGEYLPFMDSLKGSLAFLDRKRNLLSPQQSGKLDGALSGVKKFQSKLDQAEQIKQFAKERKQYLQDVVSKYSSLPKSISKQLQSYNKELYYYSEQIREYREIFRDPGKLQKKALALLNRTPAFQQFMKENSALAGLFNLPADYGSPVSLAGLQTRVQVQQNITSQMGGAANAGQQFGQQVQAAQTQLSQFKQKLDQLGGGSGDIEMPDFKPNSARTKTFFQRLEFGTNFQSTKSNTFYPSTTDIGLSVGYRLSDKNMVGCGVSYKLGWGKDIKHIQLSSEGLSFRSFIDIKIKKSFYASGGWEYNYQQPFTSMQQLYKADSWRESGLLGMSKIVSLKSKVFKKTKLQILWDFMSYRQSPRNEALKFRVGYNF